ncbi:hypothetical protein [Hymenobacter sp. B81]|uniref:hypothetical protein n=1 Tax=Hymenobacter sp. B81 TaxID=3344878 RepID=UPI0037DD5073
MAHLLHQNAIGYTAWCLRTRHVYLNVGPVALAANTEEFARFKTRIGELWQRTVPPADPDLRYLAVRTDAHKLALVFTYPELQELWELLELTALLLAADAALNDDLPGGCTSCPFGT